MRLEINQEAIINFKGKTMEDLFINVELINDTSHVFFKTKHLVTLVYLRCEKEQAKNEIDKVKKQYFSLDFEGKKTNYNERLARLYVNLNDCIAKNNKEFTEYYAREIASIKLILLDLERN